MFSQMITEFTEDAKGRLDDGSAFSDPLNFEEILKRSEFHQLPVRYKCRISFLFHFPYEHSAYPRHPFYAHRIL